MNKDDGVRNIYINQGNYIEYINGNYIEGDFIQIDTIPRPTGFPQNIPRSSTDKFVGRQKELIRLSQQLQENDQVTIAHIEGMGGIGKTELAIAYSLTNLQCNTYPGGICWLFCRDQDIGLQIVNFARNYLGLNPPEDSELLDQVTWCWQRWQNRDTLIVLDDVTDYSKIEIYLPPQSSQFKVLITTRLKLELANPLYLKVLSESESIELLSELIGSEKVNLELATAQELCQRLGYLPLALQLVGRYVKKRRISLSEEIRRLEEKGLTHLSTPVVEKKTKVSKVIKRGVTAAFELSWEELTESAQELGCLLSLFALAPIPWSLVKSAAIEQDLEELEDIRIELEDLHLLQTEGSYQLHQLIQEFFRDKQNNLVNAEQQKRNFCTAIAEIADQIPETPTLNDITYFTPFIPHLAETINFYQNSLSDKDLISPFTGIGKFYIGQGLHKKVLSWYVKCIAVTQKRLGEEHQYFASSLHNLAGLYRNQGRYKEAEPLFLKALEIREKLLEKGCPDIIPSLHSLANLYLDQGRYEEAESLLLELLDIHNVFKEVTGEKDVGLAPILSSLACLYDEQGKYEKAEPLYLQALEISKKLLGERNINTSIHLNALALLYSKQAKYEKAEPLYLQALEIKRKLLGEEHPDFSESLNKIAFLYHQQRKYEEAERFYLQALEIRKNILGEQHPDFAANLNNIAMLYDDQGKYEEAELFYLQALKLFKKILGEEHLNVAIILDNLASLYNTQGKYEEVVTLCFQALEIKKKQFGEEHPYIGGSLSNIARLLLVLGKYEEAESFYLQTLELKTKLLGEEHPSVANTLNDLGLLYHQQGRYEDAELLYLKSIRAYQKPQIEEHPDLISILNNLAILYCHQGRYDSAKPLYTKALKISEAKLGIDHPNTKMIKEMLQNTLEQMHKQ